MLKAGKRHGRKLVPRDTALLISDFLDIKDMENWSRALDMQSVFREKIRNAKQLQNFHSFGANMIQVLIENDFIVTFRTLQRIHAASRDPPEIPNHLIFKEFSNMKPVSFFLANNLVRFDRRLHNCFYEARSTIDEKELNIDSKKISELAMPLSRRMAEHIDGTASFLLYSDIESTESFEKCAKLFKQLLNVAAGEKRLIVCCPIEGGKTPLQTLLRHLRMYHRGGLLLIDGRVPQNLEFHAISTSEVAMAHRDPFKTENFITMYESCFKCGLDL